ncbi:MAG: DUF4159 domain-containing protein [Vicinamibacterales bacterium]
MRRLLVALVMVASAAALAAGQSLRFGTRAHPVEPNPAYDGQFTFVRLRYGPPLAMVSQRIPWSHDYPDGERNFMKIMNEVTYLHPKFTESSVLGLDDPELARHPVAYMAEPGFMFLTDAEAAAFRAYLLKGGFVIFDDFAEDRGGWAAFEATFQRILPGVRFYDLEPSHPIFHAFFEIDSFDIVPQMYDVGRPVFRGIFEDNDPSKRLMAMINFNTDISEFWEFSASGFLPISETNEAYKLGVNYIMYGMTH